MQFVWVYYHNGAKFDEIRWSIRSVEANYNGPVQITIAGDRPPWYRGHHIPVKRVGGPNAFRSFRDSFNKLHTAANHPEVAEEFVWMMDDVYLVNQVNRADLAQPRHQGRICKPLKPGRRINKWQRLKRRTAEMLGLPNYDYATHLCHLLEKDKFQHVCKKYEMPANLWL